MKNKTFKQATALLIAFVMIFSMCITGTGVSAATSDSSNKTVYLLPESSWRTENMRYAAYFWNGSIHTWVNATDEDGDGYCTYKEFVKMMKFEFNDEIEVDDDEDK